MLVAILFSFMFLTKRFEKNVTKNTVTTKLITDKFNQNISLIYALGLPITVIAIYFKNDWKKEQNRIYQIISKTINHTYPAAAIHQDCDTMNHPSTRRFDYFIFKNQKIKLLFTVTKQFQILHIYSYMDLKDTINIYLSFRSGSPKRLQSSFHQEELILILSKDKELNFYFS